MRRFIDICDKIIAEGFFNAFTNSESGDYVEVFTNPSFKEFSSLFHDGYAGARGFLDTQDGGRPTLYVWDASIATHGDVDEGLGLWGQRCEWESPTSMVIFWNYDYSGPDLNNFGEVKKWLLSLDIMQRIGLKQISKG